MKITMKTTLFFSVIALPLMVTGCFEDKRTAGEKVGDAAKDLGNGRGVGNAVEELGNKNTGEKIGDAVEDAGQDIQRKAQ